jgi:Flp pilus assembly protein TadD
MAGETLLLHADTVEDVLLFGRYVGAAVARSKARVVLSVPSDMRRLMIGWMDAAVVTAARPSHDRHCPFALLPALFRARPNNVPDIDLCPWPSRPVIESWSPNVTRLRGLRVGVAFDDPLSRNAIAQVDGANLVALTSSPWAVERVLDWSAGFDDMAAVAGLIVNLDLVIAGDNAIAHLAGALGRPVWLISPVTPRWPWIPGREDNPWYPTLRQFPSVSAVATELRQMATDTPENQMFEYGNDRHRARDYRAAATGFRQTLALKPDHAGALGNLAITMLMLGRPEIAVRYAEQAVRVVPASHPLRFRFGLALHASGRFDEAVARLREAHAMEPGHTDTLTALGNALGASGALRDAIGTLRKAVELLPDNPGYHTNLAYALLRAGQWDEGWRGHEYRAERPRVLRIWDGRTLTGGSLVIRHEQGLGDIIQFCRYVPLAAERAGGEVFLTAPPPLRDLLRSLRGVSILTEDNPIPPDAFQFPLLSLPLLFGPEIPAEAPYLHADPVLVARWRVRIAALPGIRVGLVWAGNRRLGIASLAATDRRRSLPEGALAQFTAVSGVTFVSLQVGDAALPGVETIDWTRDLTDFAQTAALIATLDLVISVDTAVAHLAGALGKPVWLLNRFDTDWRWMDGREDSFWYPTMRLFRQASPGDWDEVIDRAAQALTVIGRGTNTC